MQSLLIILVVVLIVMQFLLAIVFLRMISLSKAEVRGLKKRIESLDSKCARQEKALAEMQVATVYKSDPLVETLELLSSWNKRNTVQTLVSLGARLFRSYSTYRHAKPLPVRGREEVKT